jgi:hypothetical protein
MRPAGVRDFGWWTWVGGWVWGCAREKASAVIGNDVWLCGAGFFVLLDAFHGRLDWRELASLIMMALIRHNRSLRQNSSVGCCCCCYAFETVPLQTNLPESIVPVSISVFSFLFPLFLFYFVFSFLLARCVASQWLFFFNEFSSLCDKEIFIFNSYFWKFSFLTVISTPQKMLSKWSTKFCWPCIPRQGLLCLDSF